MLQQVVVMLEMVVETVVMGKVLERISIVAAVVLGDILEMAVTENLVKLDRLEMVKGVVPGDQWLTQVDILVAVVVLVSMVKDQMVLAVLLTYIQINILRLLVQVQVVLVVKMPLALMVIQPEETMAAVAVAVGQVPVVVTQVAAL